MYHEESTHSSSSDTDAYLNKFHYLRWMHIAHWMVWFAIVEQNHCWIWSNLLLTTYLLVYCTINCSKFNVPQLLGDFVKFRNQLETRGAMWWEEVYKPDILTIRDRTRETRWVQNMDKGLETFPCKCCNICCKASTVMKLMLPSNTEEGHLREVISQIELITEGSICAAIKQCNL